MRSCSATGSPDKIGARVNSNVTLTSAEGAAMSASVVGTFHSGFRITDETTGYVLLKTAQILEMQTGIVNEIRVRTRDPMEARLISERIGEQTGYKSISWQEAQEDLLSAITLRNVLMYTIVGAILLVASFGTYNIISTITHEKTRDIAILKSLGFRNKTIRSIFIVEAMLVGLVGAMLGWVFGYLLTRGLASLEFKTPFLRLQPSAGALLGETLFARHRRCLGLQPDRRLLSGARSGAAASRRHHQGSDMNAADRGTWGDQDSRAESCRSLSCTGYQPRYHAARIHRHHRPIRFRKIISAVPPGIA